MTYTAQLIVATATAAVAITVNAVNAHKEMKRAAEHYARIANGEQYDWKAEARNPWKSI